MTKDEALDLALEALEQYTNVVTSVNDPNSWETVVDGGKPARDAITAIKQARSAPVQEPVAVVSEDKYGPFVNWLGDKSIFYERNPVGTKFFAAPPAAQRQWVGLTDEQIDKLFGDGPYVPAMLLRDVARAIEAKLKEKNT